MKPFKLTLLVSLTFLFLFSGILFAELHPLGLLKQDPTEVPWMTPATIQPTEALPTRYYNPAYLPPVGNQGSQGSCTAWAVGYYFKTYQEASEKQWDPALSEHQCSPAFMYHLINGGQDGGSFISDAFLLLEDMGCGTLADMPYNPGDFSSWPGEIAFENGVQFRTLNTHYISTATQFGIDQIKTVLNNGNLLVIGINVYPNFDNISAFNYTYCVSDVYGSIRGGHAVTIIGYDDNKVTHDGMGAFRMVNSWGTNWGQSGFWWMSYQAVQSGILCHGYAYYADDRVNYTPQLLARYQLTHPRSGSLVVKVGVGDPFSSLWEHTYFDFYMNQWATNSSPYPNHPIVLDASDGATYLTPGSQDNFYLSVSDQKWDGLTGTIDFFRGEFNAQMISATASNLPINIPEGATASATLAIGDGLSLFPFTMDFGEVTMGDSAQQTILLQNFGASTVSLNFQIASGSSTHFTLTQPTVTLTAGQTQSIPVIYYPPEQGTDTGEILVSGSDYAATIRLKGKALGTLALNPGEFDFGQVAVGDSQSTQFTIENTGSHPLLANVAITGGDAGHFHATPQQISVSPGQSETVTVTFSPLSAEMKIATLQISAPGQMQTSVLKGFGIGVSLLQFSENSLNKSVLLGDSMIAILTMENRGSAVLDFSASLQFNTGGSNWAEILNPTGNISPNGTRKLLIRLRGNAVGIYQATCLISTNEPGSPTHSIPVQLKVNEVTGPPHFTPCYTGTPYQPMTLNVIHAEWNGQELEAGDEIAIYDGNLCVGSGLLTHTAGGGINALSVPASADDPNTPGTDGFIEGNPIIFKVWDSSEGTEHIVTQLEFLTVGNQPLPQQPFTSNATVFVSLGTVTTITQSGNPSVPREFALYPNYPNPFNPSTTIRFALPERGRIHLVIYNNLGKKVRQLSNEFVSAGEYEVHWDGKNDSGNPVASGIYFYQLQFIGQKNQFSRTRKMLLVR